MPASFPWGQYEFRVESPGFSPYVNNAIVISIGKWFSFCCPVHSAVRWAVTLK